MNCCNVTIVPFAYATTTTVPYIGDKPTVSVAYLQPDRTLLVQGVMTQIDLQPGSVIIDHGGPMSGIIKIQQ